MLLLSVLWRRTNNTERTYPLNFSANFSWWSQRSLLWTNEIRSCLSLRQNTSANSCGRLVALPTPFLGGCNSLALSIGHGMNILSGQLVPPLSGTCWLLEFDDSTKNYWENAEWSGTIYVQCDLSLFHVSASLSFRPNLFRLHVSN